LEKEGLGKDHIEAYVDGSFSPEMGKYSFGCVLLLPNGEILEESGSNSNPETAKIRNVAGEMLGAMFAVQWAKLNGFRSLTIFYDYEGIEKWATHGWRAKNELTRKYADYMDQSMKIMEIRFQKVAAHTGVKYNERADELAKQALTEKDAIPKAEKYRRE